MTDRHIMEAPAPNTPVPMEGGSLPPSFWTFDMVQDRLVEAMITCWRQPDRERAWVRGGSDGPWHLIMPEPGDYDARGGLETGGEVMIRPASLTRQEVGEMEEAFGWTEMLNPLDRKLIGLAIAHLARGGREVPWRRLLAPMGLKRGADGLRMRYGRALNAICVAKNGGNAWATRVNPGKDRA
ncbi:hypothetical protein SAMN05192583_1395 [Sphingomonas gellani]|uniref:Uncharacterized protein n=1 Tax=Sphingomonas gellani TaxID=1166340 RepID=A0A1H8C2S1_9SPHN|nr:hypothetical protein [Sphingomonas gellani]SEM88377.1 hypothetical protein SAMN05192583_1395 [Sphingomonas gellani]